MPRASPIDSSPESVPRRVLSSSVNRPVWLFLRWLLKNLLRPFFRLKGFSVDGALRLPKHRGPLIVVANHAAFIDSVYFILALPVRFTICGAKPRLFRSAPLRALMRLANILRVDSHEQFLDDCGVLLERGEVLLIYPEMGRFPEGLGMFETWAAEVAVNQGTKVLPCYIYGTTRGHTGPVQLRVGEMLEVGDASLETLNLAMRHSIEGLMTEVARRPGGEA